MTEWLESWEPTEVIALLGILSGVVIGVVTVIWNSRSSTRRITADQEMQAERLSHERREAELDRVQAEKVRLDELKQKVGEVYVKVGAMLTASKPENVEATMAPFAPEDLAGMEEIRATSREFLNIMEEVERLRFIGWTNQVRAAAEWLHRSLDELRRSYFAFAWAVLRGTADEAMANAIGEAIDKASRKRDDLERFATSEAGLSSV